jgi:Na+-driven multidrug efflux pump
MSLGISFIIFIILNLVPEFFLSFYSQGDEFIAEAIPIVRIVSIALLMMSFGTIWLNAVTGTGNSRVNLLIELVTIVIYVAYVYFVLEYWNLSVAWGWGSEWVYWISMFSMAYFYMKSGKWKGKVI